jgi:hypothetical protein
LGSSGKTHNSGPISGLLGEPMWVYNNIRLVTSLDMVQLAAACGLRPQMAPPFGSQARGGRELGHGRHVVDELSVELYSSNR